MAGSNRRSGIVSLYSSWYYLGDVREYPNSGTILAVRFFEPTPGRQNVITKFLKQDLKKRRDAQSALLRHLRILEDTQIRTLREQQRLEHITGEILSYKFTVPGGWLRLLCALWPTDNDVIILRPIVKKRNDLDPEDIKLAKNNLRMLRERSSE